MFEARARHSLDTGPPIEIEKFIESQPSVVDLRGQCLLVWCLCTLRVASNCVQLILRSVQHDLIATQYGAKKMVLLLERIFEISLIENRLVDRTIDSLLDAAKPT